MIHNIVNFSIHTVSTTHCKIMREQRTENVSGFKGLKGNEANTITWLGLKLNMTVSDKLLVQQIRWPLAFWPPCKQILLFLMVYPHCSTILKTRCSHSPTYSNPISKSSKLSHKEQVFSTFHFVFRPTNSKCGRQLKNIWGQFDINHRTLTDYYWRLICAFFHFLDFWESCPCMGASLQRDYTFFNDHVLSENNLLKSSPLLKSPILFILI